MVKFAIIFVMLTSSFISSQSIPSLNKTYITFGEIWSDSRLKDVEGDYEKGLKEIIELQPVEYSYKKDNPMKLPSDPIHIGFIAQDVKDVFPQAVSEGEDGYLKLDMSSVYAAMVNAFKELMEENDLLKEENEKIHDQVDKIKEQYDEISERLIKTEEYINRVQNIK